jgi:hypothetical protein
MQPLLSLSVKLIPERCGNNVLKAATPLKEK